MDGQEIELSVGDVIVAGEYTITVIDIDGPDVSFRIDGTESEELVLHGEPSDVFRAMK